MPASGARSDGRGIPVEPFAANAAGQDGVETMEDPDRRQQDRFLRLFMEQEESLRGFVRSLVPSHEDCREVMQEVASVLWRKFDALENPADFRRWAFGVARIEALDHVRRARRDRHVFSDALLAQLADEAEAAVDEFAVERQALDACIRKLPDSQRALIESAYAPGTRIDRLAEELGRTPMALYKALHRIRMTLLECTRRELREKPSP